MVFTQDLQAPSSFDSDHWYDNIPAGCVGSFCWGGAQPAPSGGGGYTPPYQPPSGGYFPAPAPAPSVREVDYTPILIGLAAILLLFVVLK